MLRSILHCDMNNFYASVECMLDPALKKYPIAVCGSVEERHGIVLAKNYKAKAFDVKTGDAVWQAKQKCKDLVVVPPHYEEYIKYSKLARSVYERYTDQVEPYGMDECWLDISGTESLFGSPEKVANEIRETMKFELGFEIPLYAKSIITSLRSSVGENIRVFESEIPFSVRAAECSLSGESIFSHDKNGKVAAAYEALTKEVTEIEERAKNRPGPDWIR